MDIAPLLAIGFVVAMVVKVIYHLITTKKKRMLWAGSEPITDEVWRAWYFSVWWETYAVIDPEDRVNHEPTPHVWIYKDGDFLPSYLGQSLFGWWSLKERAIFVTQRSKNNRNLVRHECAHDIMSELNHPTKYFSDGTYIMKQFR